jgi:hypothetical protein
MKWEYRVVSFIFQDEEQLETRLNEHGQDGWDLVNIETAWLDDIRATSTRCIFKRAIWEEEK